MKYLNFNDGYLYIVTYKRFFDYMKIIYEFKFLNKLLKNHILLLVNIYEHDFTTIEFVLLKKRNNYLNTIKEEIKHKDYSFLNEYYYEPYTFIHRNNEEMIPKYIHDNIINHKEIQELIMKDQKLKYLYMKKINS
jgi:hypothetical protein